MRRWARRIATRRISWTDQRIRARADEASSLFLGAARCSRVGAPRPSWRRRAGRARHADASRARTGSRCAPAPARFWRSRTRPQSPNGALQPSPACRFQFRPGTRSRRTQARPPQGCAGSEARASTGRRGPRCIRPHPGRPAHNTPSHTAARLSYRPPRRGAAKRPPRALPRSPRRCRPPTASCPKRRRPPRDGVLPQELNTSVAFAPST